MRLEFGYGENNQFFELRSSKINGFKFEGKEDDNYFLITLFTEFGTFEHLLANKHDISALRDALDE